MMRSPRALVLGAAGQDGSYMTELLLEHGYTVVAVVRRDSVEATSNLQGVRDRVQLVVADLTDTEALAGLLAAHQFTEVYNFASVSFGPDAWSEPVVTAELGTLAVARLLEALRQSDPAPRFFQASSAWVFGQPTVSPQDETTPYAPVEPYGAAKAFGDFLIRAYRYRHGLFACSGLLYNHESPRRPERFVTRKITRAAAAVSLGISSRLVLGDLDARRDWGYAKDYVDAAWRMLQVPEPADYVIATGEPHTVRELVETAFQVVGLEWQQHVTVDSALIRPAGGVADLVGDASAARKELGWAPTVSFEKLVRLMVEADLADLSARTRDA
jgi:GDPmannose 4,6-dehydratase